MRNVFFLMVLALVYAGCKKKDNTLPVITLTGGDAVQVILNTPWPEPGYSASDDRDGDITQYVEVTGTVNKDFAGTYEITYTVFDKAGNEGTAIRKVTVYNEAGLLSGKYAGFDTCMATSKTYTATLTPSNSVNREFSVENFGGWNSTCSCKAVVKIKTSGTALNSTLSWNGQGIANNDSLTASTSGGTLSGLSPIQLQLTYQWKNGSSTETCTGLYIRQ